MVQVRLAQDWTDPDGTSYAAGTTLDVDAGTLAELEAQGIVADPGGTGSANWIGPTGGSTTGGGGN